jgi:hypothetical protein
MGTNYYAKIIPTKERKEQLKKLIDTGLWEDILAEIHKTFDSFTPYTLDEPLTGSIHLCKQSAGWKTLWNPNIYQIRMGHMEWTDTAGGGKSGIFVNDPDVPRYIYPLTKKGIKAFIDREDIEIYDEYGDKQDKEMFWKDAIERDTIKWHGKEPWSHATYEAEHPNEQHYSCVNNYTNFLMSLGFVPSSSTWSEFVSDGLRFASTTEFC